MLLAGCLLFLLFDCAGAVASKALNLNTRYMRAESIGSVHAELDAEGYALSADRKEGGPQAMEISAKAAQELVQAQAESTEGALHTEEEEDDEQDFTRMLDFSSFGENLKHMGINLAEVEAEEATPGADENIRQIRMDQRREHLKKFGWFVGNYSDKSTSCAAETTSTGCAHGDRCWEMTFPSDVMICRSRHLDYYYRNITRTSVSFTLMPNANCHYGLWGRMLDTAGCPLDRYAPYYEGWVYHSKFGPHGWDPMADTEETGDESSSDTTGTTTLPFRWCYKYHRKPHWRVCARAGWSPKHPLLKATECDPNDDGAADGAYDAAACAAKSNRKCFTISRVNKLYPCLPECLSSHGHKCKELPAVNACPVSDETSITGKPCQCDKKAIGNECKAGRHCYKKDDEHTQRCHDCPKVGACESDER